MRSISDLLDEPVEHSNGGQSKRDPHKDPHPAVPAWKNYLPARAKTTQDSVWNSKKLADGRPLRIAVIPDTHVPRQDKRAWSTALAIVREFNPNAVVIIGDFADLESLSHHPKNRPDLTKLAFEYYETNVALDLVQNVAPSAKFYYVEGNHEYRAVKYVNAFPHLDGLLSVPENLFIMPPGSKSIATAGGLKSRQSSRVHVDLRGMEWIPFRHYLRRAWKSPWGCGYMHSAKGNGSWGSGGKHHAAYHADNVGPVSECKTIVYGHHHSFQYYRNAAGFEAFCSGFLGDFDADEPAFDYAGGPSPWVTGILLQEVSGSLIHTEQVEIKQGRALFRGDLYK